MKKLLKTLFILTIFIVTFLTTSYFLYSKYKINLINNVNKDVFMNNSYTNNENTEVKEEESDNKDIIGTITIDELQINEKILQSSNNSYYMNHDINNNYNEMGSIFLDYRNTLDSKKLLIYGHNSQYIDTLFGRLENYLDLEFLKNNPYIKTNFNGIDYIYQIFSIMIVPNTTKTHTRIEFSTGKELEEHILWMKNNSIVNLEVDVNINDQLMTLQTCYYEPEDSFLLINLKKVGDNNGKKNSEIN